MSTGDYYRYDLHKERARRLSILAQPSRVGRPRYLETADLTDWARITRKAIQRVAEISSVNGVDGAEAWKLEATADDNNFIIRGGDNTDDGAKAAWIGGLRALLYRDTDYNCTLNAPNEQDLFAIHHKASAIALNQLTDTASKYAVNALVGYDIHIEGAGDFTVTANTPSTITLAGFNPGDYGFTEASRPYYWIALKAPVAGATQAVYLDIHIEDWGMAEDAELNHNPRGAPVEWARREVLIQRIFVNQNNEMPVVNYNDSLGRKHYVLKIGAIIRLAGDDTIPEVSDDDREDQASSAQEVLDARGFAHFEVGVDHNDDGTISSAQPTTLAERLAREESLLVVGPTGDPGIYTGPDGLLEALAIGNGAPGAPHTVFLRNGIYDFSSKGTIVVPAGWTLTGESKGVALVLDSTADIGLKIESGAKVENVYVTCASGDNPGVLLAGSNSYLGRGPTLSRCVVSATITNGDTPAILVRGYEDDATGVVTGGATIRDCQIFKLRGVAVKVELRNVGAAVQNSARAAFSNGTSSDLDSYHVNIENCRIYSGRQLASAGAFKKTNAALNISTHASVLVNRTLLVGDENPALYISGSNATAFRHQVFFSDCTFLGLCRDGTISGVGVPSLVSAAYQPFTELDLARVEGGSTIFDSCLWDTCHPGLAFASLSTGPVSLLAISDTPVSVPLAAQVSACRFEVNGGTSIASTAVGLSTRILETGSSVEISGCTARVLDVGYPKALYYLENHSNGSAVSIHDSSADNGNRLSTGFFLVGNATASDIKSVGGVVAGSDVILTRAQVEAAGSTGLRIDTVNLFGVTLDTPAITQVSGFKASACGGVGVAILGSAVVPFSRASLSGVVIDGLNGTTSATSVGVVVDNYFGVTIDGLSLGGIKSCGVFCSSIEIGCAVNGVTVHEVGTAHDFANPSTTPWYGAALVNVMHSRELKFFNRSRSVAVPAKMHLAAYYSNGSSATSATASGFDIHGGSTTNGIQAGRVGASYIGSLFISDCHMNAVSRAIILYEGVTAHISACNIFNFLAYGLYALGSSRVDVVATEMFSTAGGSAAILATQGLSQLRVSGCRIKSSAKAVYSDGSGEVFIHNSRLLSEIPQTVSISGASRFEMTDTTLGSEQNAPKTFNRSAPTTTASTLICSGVSYLKVSGCQMRLGAVVYQCRGVDFDRCEFSTVALTGLIIIPPASSPSNNNVKLKDCVAFGNSGASQAELQCAVWFAPIRDFDTEYNRSTWGGVLEVVGGEYYGSKSHGGLTTSNAASRPAAIRADALNVLIHDCRIDVLGADSAAVIAGNMDFVQTASAADTPTQYRIGVDRFQFRNNEIISPSSGVVAAVLEPGKPHEIRDNLFRAFSVVGDVLADRNCFFLLTTEDEDNAFGGNNDYMTRVLYTGNCHMIMGSEQYGGELSSPFLAAILTSYAVCLDAFGNLVREETSYQNNGWFEVDGAFTDEGLGPVEKLNSIRRPRRFINRECQIIEANLRLSEW